MCPDSSPADFQPRIVVLCCRQALAGNVDLESAIHPPKGLSVTPFVIPCTGKIEAHYLLKYLAQGYDGIEIIGCPESQCQHLNGNARAQRRIQRARQLLLQAGLSPDRIGMDHGTELTADQVMTLVEARVNAIRPLGNNPMKREHAK